MGGWTSFVLHGGRTGAEDALIDTLLLLLPILAAGAMVFAPRLLAWLRAPAPGDDTPDVRGDEPI